MNHRAIGPVLVIALLCAASLAAAQEPLTRFDQLNTWLRPGDTVWVTDATGREVKGRIWSLAPDTLTLGEGGARAFTDRDVRLIRERKDDRLWNGMLIGLGVGGALGLSMGNFSGSWRWGDAAAGFVIFGGIGAAIGVGVDALIPGKRLVVYRAPAGPGAVPARFSIAPVVTPRAKGVAVSFAF